MDKPRKNWKKILIAMRADIVIFVVLIVIGSVSFSFVKTALLKNSQELGSSLAASCASEESNSLTVYETLLSFGADTISSNIDVWEYGDMENWLRAYSNRIQMALGQGTVDMYAVIDGKIIAVNPWEGDETYDYSSSSWYQMAISSDKAVFTDVYTDAIYNRPVITMAKGCGENDVLAFDIFPENIQLEKSAFELPDGASVFLCDSNGTLIYSQLEKKYPKNEVQEYFNGIFNGIKSGEHDKYDSFVMDMDGNKRGAYYKTMPNGWLAVVTIPFSSILHDLRSFTTGSLIVFMFLILTLVLITLKDLKFNWQIERTNETVRVLGNSYYAIYRVDFVKNTYEMIKGSDYIRSRMEKTGRYDELLKTMVEVIEKDACDEYMESFSVENIRKLVSQRIRDFGGDFLRKFGDEYHWVNVRVLFDESLAPGEVVLCFREADLEKRQQLQERKLLETSLEASRQSEKSKQAFFSNMSHDMRTPLNAIIGISELASKAVDNPEKISEYLDKINLSSRQLLELINDILDMSRMEQGKVVLNTQKFDLKKCINDCCENFRFQAEKDSKAFEINFNIENSKVMGDPFRVSQVINNLLSNAFKFTSANDSVKVEVSQLEKGDYSKYKIVVSDTGLGMSEDFLKKVFEPYARETRFSTKKIAGTGLGMAIVKNLVDQMNGHIYVESRLGDGSAFTVTLPFITDEEEEILAQESTKNDNKKAFSLEGKNILLAEDNMINMEVATEILSMNGINIVQAWNGKEAVEIFKKSKEFEFDAILMDMQMPEMGGCDAAKAIRALNRSDAGKVPIIAVTANAFAEDISATAEAGMNAHISKPIDFNILCGTLEELINEN